MSRFWLVGSEAFTAMNKPGPRPLAKTGHELHDVVSQLRRIGPLDGVRLFFSQSLRWLLAGICADDVLR